MESISSLGIFHLSANNKIHITWKKKQEKKPKIRCSRVDGEKSRSNISVYNDGILMFISLYVQFLIDGSRLPHGMVVCLCSLKREIPYPCNLISRRFCGSVFRIDCPIHWDGVCFNIMQDQTFNELGAFGLNGWRGLCYRCFDAIPWYES